MLFSKASKNTNFIVNNTQLIKETARQTLLIEAQTLAQLSTSINDEFCKIVEWIFQSKGRVVVTGIGKSAIVAQKIVATLNSTGTPALFMHAADAIHGDLGMIRPDDIIICLSKSGETAEIKILIPLIKQLGSRVIGMTSNKISYLAKRANALLYTPISSEADPNNLAPTASTTAQMAMGDALATALLALRGFSPQDFAQYHPGGALGKQLYLRVHDIYPQNEKPTTYCTDSIRSTILEMTSKRLGMTVVLNKDHELAGIITDGDLRRMLEREADTKHLCAKDIMTASPKTIEENQLAVKALEVMRTNSITQLVVVNQQNEYLGIVHLHDLIKEGLI